MAGIESLFTGQMAVLIKVSESLSFPWIPNFAIKGTKVSSYFELQKTTAKGFLKKSHNFAN